MGRRSESRCRRSLGRPATPKLPRRDPTPTIVILSKTHASTEKEIWADLDRFRKEMGTDHIDIVLLHCMLDANWAQEKEIGRAHV